MASINRPADRGALQSSDLPHELVALVSSGMTASTAPVYNSILVQLIQVMAGSTMQVCNALCRLPAGIPDTPAARREQLAVLDSHIEWLQDAEKQQNHDVALRDKSIDARQQQLSGLEHSISKERHSAVSTAALQLLSRKQSQVSGCGRARCGMKQSPQLHMSFLSRKKSRGCCNAECATRLVCSS